MSVRSSQLHVSVPNTKYIAPTLRYGKSCKIKHVYKAASKTDSFGPKSSNNQSFFSSFLMKTELNRKT